MRVLIAKNGCRNPVGSDGEVLDEGGRKTSKAWLGCLGILTALQPITCDVSWGTALLLGPVLGVSMVVGVVLVSRAIRNVGIGR